ncbi:uncharacterized protein LOC126749604 [Anthonomus grandis grandis]|uniref:uncharacterized protein LOC126749604 n=1 Tax=Anthonomus grandis grandis TaxID=2921223 RepID=UPI002165D7FF|nr:uncharacterized protein LOC126749604 [Anthonomus grandis grandis]
MPILLSRQLSTASLATIVEKCQRQPTTPPLEYDLHLRNNQLDLVLLSDPPTAITKPIIPPKPKDLSKSPVLPKGVIAIADEGFESDIDTISLISSENESFKQPSTETDSANGGSGTESDTETDKTNTLTPKNVNSIKESFVKPKETFDLVDCVCYSDVTYPDVLIFVIKNEALVFKFDDLEKLRAFYSNFTTLKAVTNQKAYNLGKNVATKYNLFQRTDQNGVTHIEIKKQNFKQSYNPSGPSSIISIDTPDGTLTKKQAEVDDAKSNKNKDVNLRQRSESKIINDMKLLNDVKFNTINNKVGQKKMIVKSSSIENILNLDSKESNLVKEDVVGTLRKVWNSAEDLLNSDAPRRPERRRKKKPAPLPPPQTQPLPPEDIFSGQFVRVNVSVDPQKDPTATEKTRLLVKSTANEPHPKKLGQNFNLTSLLKSNKPEPSRTQPFTNATLNRPQRTPIYEKNNSWTNSVPRMLKKNLRSKSETRNFQPMAYRYIDTTATDYPYNNPATQNNAMFLTATGLRPKPHSAHNVDAVKHQPRISFGYNVAGFTKNQENSMGNRVFGLTPKLKDFSSKGEGGNKWGSTSDLTFLSKEKNNLKSSIKSGGEAVGKKKNEKKVTFSAYTTVQVV